MSYIRKNKLFVFSMILSFLVLIGVYFVTSVGVRNSTLFLQMRRYIPCAIAVAIAITLWEKAGLSLGKLLPHALVGFLWVVVYPFCYWSAFHQSLTFIDNHFDQAFGAYVFAFSVCVRVLLLKLNNWEDKKIIQYTFGLLHSIALFIPLLQIGYFVNYKYPITEAAAIAVLQTNPAEAQEFLLLNFGYFGLLSIVAFIAVLCLLLCKLNSLDWSAKFVDFGVEFGKKSFVCALVVIIATAGYGTKMFKDTGVMQAFVFAKDYFERTNKFREFHDKNFAQLEVSPSKPQFSKPSTIIVVIGESASSYYMSAYSDVKNDNTPWLRSMKGNDNFILFTHAYTSKCQTVPALERALTEKNQYNDKEFNQSLTIIDVAKKAGYETYWFSNQGYISDADTPITLVAKTADHAKWLSEDKSLKGKPQYDGDLLKYLYEVNPNKNNFIVLHFMGSHEDCINRYPPEFAKFSKPHEFDMVKNYDDSLAYTDYVLKKTYEYAYSNLNLQAMLYFSDHGGDPYRKRHPDVAGFKSLQIPLFVYVSNEYRTIYNESIQTYKQNRNKYFTNDMLYEVICDLLQIKSNNFNEGNSLLNKNYIFTPATLTTNLGEKKISDDKEPRKDG